SFTPHSGPKLSFCCFQAARAYAKTSPFRRSFARKDARPMNASLRDNGFFTETLTSRDPEIASAIDKELGRQRDEIELIASENIVSKAVLEAQGTVLTNKYAEGYPGKRYYGGCQYVDIVETRAIERA